MAFHLALENRRDVERRQVQRHGLGIDLDPLHHLIRRILASGTLRIGANAAPALERRCQLLTATQTVRQAFAALGLAVEMAVHFGNRGGKALQRILEACFGLDAPRRQAQVLALHRQAQVARRLFQRRGRVLQGRVVLGGNDALIARIARQLDDLGGGQAFAEEQAGHLGQLVRLVEDDRVAGRQQLAHAFVLEHDVGKEQVVVDHHHVGGQGILPRRQHEAALLMRAFLAEAVLPRRGGDRPGAGILRHIDALGLVAGSGALGEAHDLAQVRGFLARRQACRRQGALQVVGADVIGAPLEQRNRRANTQRIAHRRQVAIEELVLQGLGAGGDDHLAAREQGRHQIGEGLAGAGAGLGHQRLVVGDRLGDALRHFHLLRPRPEGGNGSSERPIGGEDSVEIRHGGRGMVARDRCAHRR
jgi:hypothetical protein